MFFHIVTSMIENPSFKITPYILYDEYENHELLRNVMENDAIYGNKDAMNIMGVLSTDVTEILKWFQMAAGKKSIDAMYNLGLYYKVKKQTDIMLKWFMSATEFGDMDANYQLALYYYKIGSIGIMMKYLDEGVSRCHGDTLQFMVAYCKMNKDHMSENKYLMMCKEQNYLSPQQKKQFADESYYNENYMEALALYSDILKAYFENNKIGEIYDNVVVCLKHAKNDENLRVFIEQAVGHEHPRAYYDFGMILNQAKKDSLPYFMNGAFYNEPKCLHMVGVHHYNIKDKEMAKKYFELAAIFGNLKSRFHLGVICENEKDFDGMLSHFEAVGNMYQGAAYYRMANYYINIGKKDIAFDLYIQAANNGHIQSQLLLADYYQKICDDVKLFKYVDLVLQHNDSRFSSRANIILARYHLRNKDYDAVREYLLRSLTTTCAENDLNNLLNGDDVIYKSLFIDRLTDEQKAKMRAQLEDPTIIEEHNKNHKDHEIWQYVECLICMKFILRAQIKEYDCDCTKKHCCEECVDKIEKCPTCRVYIS